MSIPADILTDPKVQGAIHDTLYSVMQLVAIGLCSLAGWAIKTWLSSMQSSWKQSVAARLVAYAEQTLVDNPDKQAYVSNKLVEMFKISNEEAAHLIEEAVVALKTQQGGSK